MLKRMHGSVHASSIRHHGGKSIEKERLFQDEHVHHEVKRGIVFAQARSLHQPSSPATAPPITPTPPAYGNDSCAASRTGTSPSGSVGFVSNGASRSPSRVQALCCTPPQPTRAGPDLPQVLACRGGCCSTPDQSQEESQHSLVSITSGAPPLACGALARPIIGLLVCAQAQGALGSSEEFPRRTAENRHVGKRAKCGQSTRRGIRTRVDWPTTSPSTPLPPEELVLYTTGSRI